MASGKQEAGELPDKFENLCIAQAECSGAPKWSAHSFTLALEALGDALRWQWQPWEVFAMAQVHTYLGLHASWWILFWIEDNKRILFSQNN